MSNRIKYIQGNLFTSTCQTLVNTVNCFGVMNAGIALEFRYRYPAMFDKYKLYCEQKLIQIGKLWVYDIPNSDKKILNFPTKYHWKYPSKYEYLEKGLQKFFDTYQEKGITSIAFPLLGTLNGKLETQKVLELMYKYLIHCDIPIEIYEYNPQEKDDLIELFYDYFQKQSISNIHKQIGISPRNVEKIFHILQENQLNTLLQLKDFKGISEDTLQKCFLFAMKIKENNLSPILTLF